jgi:DNA-binding NarL/FixJ family response regulator
MKQDKPMPILLVEDDAAECRRFKDCAAGQTDVNLIGATGSSDDALRIVKNRLPECVILDLELSKGEGTGLQFLAELQKTTLTLRPIVVVTTNIQSEVMSDHVHGMGVAFVFSKKQPGYSPELVINTLLSLRKALPSAQKGDIHRDLQTIESPEELRTRIIERIDAELNDIGISIRLKGRHYLREAIYLLVNIEKNQSTAVLYQVADQNRVNYNSVIRAIQTVIENAWESSDIETLKEKCPVHIDINTGIPAPTEFIHYYAERIRKTM